jgi:predicted flap endonuclease-1-like 5' DNA nuclease
MAKRKASFEAQLFAWGGAAALAVLVFVLLLVLGGWLFIQALWMAAVVFLLVGAFNYFVFAKPVPPLAGGFEPGQTLRKGAAPAAASAPKPAAAPAPEVKAASPAAGRAPGALDAPQGEPDDLKQIKGVGPKLEEMLHGMGVYHFHQIAAWGPDEVAWADENLEGFKGRVSRDDWVAQARTLAAGGETEFSARQAAGEAD